MLWMAAGPPTLSSSAAVCSDVWCVLSITFRGTSPAEKGHDAAAVPIASLVVLVLTSLLCRVLAVLVWTSVAV